MHYIFYWLVSDLNFLLSALPPGVLDWHILIARVRRLCQTVYLHWQTTLALNCITPPPWLIVLERYYWGYRNQLIYIYFFLTLYYKDDFEILKISVKRVELFILFFITFLFIPYTIKINLILAYNYILQNMYDNLIFLLYYSNKRLQASNLLIFLCYLSYNMGYIFG